MAARVVRWAAAGVLAVPLAIAAGLGAPKSVTAQTPSDAPVEASGGAPVQMSDVGGVLPGDLVAVAIWNEPMMSDTLNVDPRGEIVLPKVGPVLVAGLTPLEVQDFVRRELEDVLRNPSVEVTVLRRIGVMGEVPEPTVYWLDVTMTVRDAIAMAGGVTPQGDQNEITLIRGDDRVELDGNGNAALVQVGLRSGDQIVVGRKSWFRLNAPYVISSGISLASLITTIILAR